MKRLSRLLLFAPPAGCMIILPLIYNLLLRHPSCAPLIHRVTEVQPTGVLAIEPETQILRDPFVFEENDPHKSNAMESSLWELVIVKQHYCPMVAKFVRVFEEVFRIQPYSMDKFLDYSYESVQILFFSFLLSFLFFAFFSCLSHLSFSFMIEVLEDRAENDERRPRP